MYQFGRQFFGFAKCAVRKAVNPKNRLEIQHRVVFGQQAPSERFAEAEVFVPSTALGELYYGARKSTHPTENQSRAICRRSSSAKLRCSDRVDLW